jgi:hypothetical protein
MRIVENLLSYSKLANHLRALPNLRHNSIVKFSDSFHLCRSDIFKTSTRSVFSSPVENCTKKSLCWINSIPSNRSIVVKRYHKCIGISTESSGCIRFPKSLNQYRKMVWITDLDNPQVFSNVKLDSNHSILCLLSKSQKV